MDRHGKYISYDRLFNCFDQIVAFPQCFQHFDINKALGMLADAPMAAGFVNFDENGPQFFGESSSLDIASQSDDQDIGVKLFADAKYIMVEHPELKLPCPIIFSKGIEHATMANQLGLNVISAGFCSITTEVRVWGESVGLGLQSSDRDARFIQVHFKA